MPLIRRTIASSLQQISMGFGLSCGSLVTAWYLGDLPQTDQLAVTSALHKTFLTPGVLTMISSATFWTLKENDGESVSKGRLNAPVNRGVAVDAANKHL
jgi:hypothetical protein